MKDKSKRTLVRLPDRATGRQPPREAPRGAPVTIGFDPAAGDRSPEGDDADRDWPHTAEDHEALRRLIACIYAYESMGNTARIDRVLPRFGTDLVARAVLGGYLMLRPKAYALALRMKGHHYRKPPEIAGATVEWWCDEMADLDPETIEELRRRVDAAVERSEGGEQ